jgi:hypothetical protein
MAFHADFDSDESLLRHSCDKYRDAAVGAAVIQQWRKPDGNVVEIEVLPGHEFSADAIEGADYEGCMPQEVAAKKAGELSLKLEQFFIAS